MACESPYSSSLKGRYHLRGGNKAGSGIKERSQVCRGERGKCLGEREKFLQLEESENTWNNGGGFRLTKRIHLWSEGLV